MTTPHVLDLAGREAYRKQLISEIRAEGGSIADTATIEEARRYRQGFQNTAVNAPSPAPIAKAVEHDATVVQPEPVKRKYIRRQ